MSGRHSSDGSWGYYLTVVGYFIPWILVATVIAGGVWLGVGAMGDDELATNPPAATDESPTPEPTTSDSPEPANSETPDAKDEGDETDKTVELITDNITVQVLNGTNDSAADDDMADRLAGLGYEVVAVESASVPYSKTTVLWSYAESRAAAERLSQRFGWRVEPKPDNLSTSVAVHVIVGADEAD